MDIYNFMRRKYEEHKKTGKSSVKFPEVEKIKKTKIDTQQLKLSKNKSNIYKCGHQIKTLIINTSAYTLSVYTDWLYNNKKNLCLDCWLKDRNKETS